MVLYTLISRLSDAMPLVSGRRRKLPRCGPRIARCWRAGAHPPVRRLPVPPCPHPAHPQVASTDSAGGGREMEDHKQQAKAIVKRLNSRSPSKMSIDSGQLSFKWVPGARARRAWGQLLHGAGAGAGGAGRPVSVR